MTPSDRLGKFIASKLYAHAIRHPGRPTMTSYTNRVRADSFCRWWPWSWHKSTSRGR